MPAPATAGEAVFQALVDIWTADATKFGGAGGATGPAGVRAFLRRGDEQLRPTGGGERANIQPPVVVVDIQEPADPAATVQGAEILVRLSLVTKRDRSLTDQNVAAAEIVAAYHEQVIQSATVTAMGWDLQRPCYLGAAPGPSDGDHNRFIMSFSILAERV